MFGGVFSLLGLLTLSLVLDEPKVGANVGFLMIAVLFFAAGAWIFGTALRMPFRAHPLGEPRVTIAERAAPGEAIEVKVELAPPQPLVVEQAIAELVCVEVEGQTWRELHRSSTPLRIETATLTATLTIPQNAMPTRDDPPRRRGWSIRILIVTDAGPDWTTEHTIGVGV